MLLKIINKPQRENIYIFELSGIYLHGSAVACELKKDPSEGFTFFAAEMRIRTLFQVKMFINTNYSDIYSSNLLEYGINWKIYTILSQKKSMYTVILIAAYWLLPDSFEGFCTCSLKNGLLFSMSDGGKLRIRYEERNEGISGGCVTEDVTEPPRRCRWPGIALCGCNPYCRGIGNSWAGRNPNTPGGWVVSVNKPGTLRYWSPEIVLRGCNSEIPGGGATVMMPEPLRWVSPVLYGERNSGISGGWVAEDVTEPPRCRWPGIALCGCSPCNGDPVSPRGKRNSENPGGSGSDEISESPGYGSLEIVPCCSNPCSGGSNIPWSTGNTLEGARPWLDTCAVVTGTKTWPDVKKNEGTN